MRTLHYGARSFADIYASAAKAVGVFGGHRQHVQLLMGTCCTETDLCGYPDKHPDKWGVGATQFDKVRFLDVQRRTRHVDKVKFEKAYGMLLDDVVLADLANNLELAFALCRLAYKLIPSAIPLTKRAQATYWKKHWNTYHPNAKGTVEGYLTDWAVYMPTWV